MSELVHQCNHPLVQHKLTDLRNRDTDPPTFRQLLRDLTVLLLHEDAVSHPTAASISAGVGIRTRSARAVRPLHILAHYDIESALFYDEAVRSYRVKIDVAEGLVTLSGQVDSDAEKRKAEEDAHVIPGVKTVCNNLTVQPAT